MNRTSFTDEDIGRIFKVHLTKPEEEHALYAAEHWGHDNNSWLIAHNRGQLVRCEEIGDCHWSARFLAEDGTEGWAFRREVTPTQGYSFTPKQLAFTF